MDLRAFDLNLLVSLDALLREESVTKAAKRVGVGQPAMSSALSRLREALGDPLLVRTGKGTKLTERARLLRDAVPKLLAEIEGTLAPERAFDPKKHELVVRLRAADYAELTILAPVVAELRTSAPNVAVHVRPPGAKPAEELASGDVDLVLGVVREAPEDLFRQVLFRDELAVVAAKGHRLGERPSIDALAEVPHVAVAPRGLFKPTRIDGLCARRVLAVVPQFTGAVALVERSDLVAIIPRRAAQALARGREIDVLPSPFDVPPQEVVQAWHARTHRDPAHAWFRARIAAIALVALGCSKTPPNEPLDAGPTVLVPMETSASPPAPSASIPRPGPAPWAMRYSDDLDLPADAGSDGRCSAPGTVDAAVKLSLVQSGTGIELSIPATSTTKKLWQSSPNGVGSCSASRSGDALRFHCGEDLASIDGKVYARGSNVIVSHASSVDGQKHERFALPCGSRPKLEPIVCPSRCVAREGECVCQPIGAGPAPSK